MFYHHIYAVACDIVATGCVMMILFNRQTQEFMDCSIADRVTQLDLAIDDDFIACSCCANTIFCIDMVYEVSCIESTDLLIDAVVDE